MSEYISREAVLSLIKQACNPYGKPTIDFEVGKRMMQVVEQMPSADIMECAMALKEYCNNTRCENCEFDTSGWLCRVAQAMPGCWDLPEGEKDLKNKG